MILTVSGTWHTQCNHIESFVHSNKAFTPTTDPICPAWNRRHKALTRSRDPGELEGVVEVSP